MVVFFASAVAVLGQEATGSEELLKEKIKERLEKSVADDVRGIQDELENQKKKKAFSGLIKTTNEPKLTLQTDFGEREASFSAETEILYYKPGEGQKKIMFTALKTQDFVMLMGIFNNQVLDVKRAIKMDAPDTKDLRKLLFGKVLEVDTKEIVMAQEPSKEKITLKIEKETKLKIKGKIEANVESIEIGDQIFCIVLMKDNKISKVTNLLVVPGKNNPLQEEKLEEATKGAKATPAKLSSTPSPSL